MPAEWSEATQGKPYTSTVYKWPSEEKVFCHFPKPLHVLPTHSMLPQSDHVQQKRSLNSLEGRMTEKDMKLVQLERNTHKLNFGMDRKYCID